MLCVNDIYKSFGEKKVLKGINFKVEPGAAYGLLGRNGAGKTTTIRIIMDLIQADSGEILINNIANTKSKVKIGYLPEERGLYPKKLVCEQMHYIGELRGLSPKEAVRRSQMLLERLEAAEYYKKKLDTLSKGNQQKIQLAISLLNDPDIIILDEPFSGLDPINANILKSVVSEYIQMGRHVLFSSHQMASIEEFCTDICIIDQGELVLNGNIKQIKKSYNSKKVMIVPENNCDTYASELKKRFNDYTDFVTTKDKIHITLNDRSAKNRLLEVISSIPSPIEQYGVIEPSLEDIFIEKVGRFDDAVQKPNETKAPKSLLGKLLSRSRGE